MTETTKETYKKIKLSIVRIMKKSYRGTTKCIASMYLDTCLIYHVINWRIIYRENIFIYLPTQRVYAQWRNATILWTLSILLAFFHSLVRWLWRLISNWQTTTWISALIEIYEMVAYLKLTFATKVIWYISDEIQFYLI